MGSFFAIKSRREAGKKGAEMGMWRERAREERRGREEGEPMMGIA